MRTDTLLLLLWCVVLAGCSGGAVVFAPTPLPPDLSPARYDHPSGAFSVIIPRTWSVYAQNVTNLATAAFAAPGTDEPALAFAVINTGETLDTERFAALLDAYQTGARPDLDRYSEGERQAMGDGSWRITGLRQSAAGATEQINTFFERSGTMIGVTDVLIPADPAQMAALQAYLNTFTINAEAPLEATSLSTLAAGHTSAFNILHVATWTTADGVFFVTGEVANRTSTAVSQVPVQVTLTNADGLIVADAADVAMGYAIAPGGFAPFSLRFGQGQPAQAARYAITLGQPVPASAFIADDALRWTDESSLDAEGRLIVRGTVTNESPETVRAVRAVITVFDAGQRVIAAAFTDVTTALPARESVAFDLLMPELGGLPANYIVQVQGLP